MLPITGASRRNLFGNFHEILVPFEPFVIHGCFLQGVGVCTRGILRRRANDIQRKA
jgi:hypothetical protein